jgi:hypothetical protein
MHVCHYGNVPVDWEVHEWPQFCNRLSSTQSGTPSSDTEAIAAVQETMKENHRVAVNDIASHLDTSRGSAHHIVHDFLQFHKYVIN